MSKWDKVFKDKNFKTVAGECETFWELASRLSKIHRMPITPNSLRHAARERLQGSLVDLLKEKPSSPVQLVEERAAVAASAKLRAEKESLVKELQLTQERFNTALSLKSPIQPPVIEAKKGPKHQATAVALASDWHVEETVDSRTVNGRNEYNLDVADERIKAYFQGIEWLLRHHRHSMQIDTLVLWLGGDLMTGYIHEELEESNALSPTQTVLWLMERLVAGIDFLKGHINLQVVCSYGNHGRTTKKRRITTGAANSYEWMMYKLLAQRYAGDKKVNFTVADGDHVYLDIYQWTLRFTHGDNFQFGGGVGGLSIPIRKGVQSLESFKHADITCMGHFHQQKDFGDIVVNGSMIGYNPYAVKINAGYEPPQQAFFLMDPECPVGKCMSTPIWLDKKK
jgi:primosomal protein N''